MKKLKLAFLAALATLAVVQTHAQQTNLVQNIRIQLWAVTQGGTTSNSFITTTTANFQSVDSRRIIAALGDATGNTFGRNSTLVLVTPLNGGPPSVQVRNGSTIVDVSGFLYVQPVGDPVLSSVTNNRNGRSFSTIYSIVRLTLQDLDGYPALNLHFDVSGFATQSSSNPNNNDLSASVAGAGTNSGHSAVYQGNVDIRGGTLEVVSSSGDTD